MTTAPPDPLGKPYAVRAQDAMRRALDYVTDGNALSHALWWYLQARTWTAIERQDFAERDVIAVLQRDLEAAQQAGDPDPVWHLAINTASALASLD